jgi:hypothetical protein
MLDYYNDYGISSYLPRRFEPQPGQPRPKVAPLAPEEESSVLGNIAGAGLGGLAYVGSVLEKALGKRAIMGGLTGNARELLSVIPFSDTLGITDPEERVGGRELLRHFGAAGDEDNWGNFAAGLGLDVAMDPATYLTFGAGALTKGGQIARRAGVLPKTAAERVGGSLNQILSHGPPTAALSDALAASGKTLAEVGAQPLGYSVGFHVPFVGNVGGLGESGLQAARMAGQGVGMLDKGLSSVPLLGGQYAGMRDLAGKGLDAAGRYGRALFHQPVMGATSHLGQETALEASEMVPRIMAQYRRKAAEYGERLAADGLDPTGDVLRAVGEGTHQGTVHPTLQAVAGSMRQDLADVLARLQNLGINVQELADLEADFLPRYATPLTKPTKGGLGAPRQPLVAADPRLAGRLEHLKNVPGGTEALNRLAADPDVYNAATDLVADELVRSKYLGMGSSSDVNSLQQRLFALQKMPDDVFKPELHAVNSPEWTQALQLRQERDGLLRQWKQGEALSRWARSLDPQFAASQAQHAGMGPSFAGFGSGPLKFFGNHPLADYQTYMDRAARLFGAGDATQNLFARTASLAQQRGYIPIAEALQKAGLTGPGGVPGYGQAEIVKRFNSLRGPGSTPIGPTATAGNALDLFVPEQSVKEATRYLRGFQAPEAVTAVGDAFDRLTNLTKAFQTAMWPAFHVRNAVSGLWQNYVKGAGEAPGGLLKQIQDAYTLSRGGVLDDANLIAEYARRGLTPEQATREIAREMYAHGVAGHLPNVARETIGPSGSMVNTGTDLDSFLGRIVGNKPGPSVGQMARNYVPTSLESVNPLNVAGVGANADLFAPVAAGRQLGDAVENVNRGSLFLALRRQGYTAEQAAKEVLSAHFDYTSAAKTGFEKAVASRAVPFYSYTRQNIPYQLEQLMQRPGGPAGQVAKASLASRQDAGFLPEYLGGGLAVPLGGEDEAGMRRYLTRLDLPPEQAFELLRGGANWLPQSLMGLMGQTNPILKAPVEYATGKQFYTGRDLGDLHSLTGTQLLDQLLANSPLSRGITTARTLADERKWQDPLSMLAIPLNLGTGARVSDVDMGRAREVAVRDAVKESLQGNQAISKFETIAPKAGAEAYLTPEEWLMLRLAKTQEQRAQARAKQASRP